MRVGGGRKADFFVDREPNNFVGGIKFVYWFAPAGRRELDGQAARRDQLERITDKIANRRCRSMAVNLDKIEMRQAIDEAGRSYLADAAKIIGVNFVDVAIGELFGPSRNAVEHLIGPIEVMDRSENEIEPIPIRLEPLAARRGSFRIVVQLDPGPDFDVGIRGAEFFDFIEIDPGVITIVIGKSDIGQSTLAGAIDPRLKEQLRVG